MRKKQKKTYDDDDGRVVSPMNVDGMPWYNRHTHKPNGEIKENVPQVNLTKKETRRLIWDLYKAMIPIALVFILGFTILILFMVFVWFK